MTRVCEMTNTKDEIDEVKSWDGGCRQGKSWDGGCRQEKSWDGRCRQGKSWDGRCRQGNADAQSLAVTGRRCCAGHPRTVTERKVSPGQTGSDHMVYHTRESSAESELSGHDQSVCEEGGVNNTNLSSTSVNLGSRGGNSSLSQRGKVTQGSEDSALLHSTSVDEANWQDVVSCAYRRSLSSPGSQIKDPKDPSSCCYSSPTKEHIPKSMCVGYQARKLEYHTHDLMTPPKTKTVDQSRHTLHQERIQFSDGNLAVEDRRNHSIKEQILRQSGGPQCPLQTIRTSHLWSCGRPYRQVCCLDHNPPERCSKNQLCAGQPAVVSSSVGGRQLVWALSLLLLSLPIMTPAQAEVRPSLATLQQNLTVVAGRTVKLTCVVENLANYKVAWMHYGLMGRIVLTVDTVVITKNPRVSLLRERGGASWSLVIANVTTTDQGIYLCQVNTVPPGKLYFQISVLVPPRISRPPEDVVVAEGEDVVLECEAMGDPQPSLTWRREDAAFPLNHSQVEAGGRRMQLPSVTRNDGGAFLCVASNGVPPAVSTRVQVSVKFSPEMVGGAVVVWAEVGGQASLVCRYRAWPTPTVTWTRDGTIIEKSVEEWGARGSGTSTLVLTSVDRESFGQYRCTVANLLGTNSSLITLAELSTTTTTTASTTMLEATPSEDAHYRVVNHVDGKVLQKKTSLVARGPPGSSSSSSSPASSWQRATSPPGDGPTDASHHRYVQDAAPPSDPRPRPLYPEATSESASASRVLHQLVHCVFSCLSLLTYLLLLLH
ncbi:uncharacterized protein [Panulirus ornatus]|uniref:uncharacterized protein isoform X2 n=1 Tax=Panulirus ornatus TaxID=150431 RepID=UPI003A88F1A8